MLLSPAHAQCTTTWSPTVGVPGTDARVNTMATWDPDGAGPATPLLVVGGEFALAGTAVASRVATYDPATGIWSALGSGLNGTVYAVAAMPNGDLVVGGQFTVAGGVPADNIARWNGSSWSALGSGTDQRVQALAALPNGDLIAGGLFSTAGGALANCIARWNGVTWSPLSTGANNQVQSLTVMPNGDVVAGGSFVTAGGVTVNRIARWNGATWSPLGAGFGVAVRALTVYPNGDLLVGFDDIGGPARWDGSTWTQLGPGTNGNVHAVVAEPNGDAIAGGTFWGAGGVPMESIARWDGTSWSAFGTGIVNSSVSAIVRLGNGDIVVGGAFAVADGNVAKNIARWNGLAWSPLGTGVAYAHKLAALANGDLVVASRVAVAGAPDIPTPARWNGAGWSALGTGFGSGSVLDDVVTALLPLPNGDLVAAGRSRTTGGTSANRITRWDGATWTTFGIPSGEVKTMITLHNGDLVVGGIFTTISGVPAPGVARWDGSVWSPMGAGIIPSSSSTQGGDVRALALLPNGDLVAGGWFSVAGGATALNIARWDGGTWSPLGSGFNIFVNALTVLPSGDLIAGGAFGNAGAVVASRVARWDGNVWSPLGAGVSVPMIGVQDRVWAVMAMPDGTVVVGGEFATAGGAPALGVARWNGSTWSTFGSGLNGSPEDFALMPNGQLAMVGGFSVAGGLAAGNFALLAPTCPATVVPAGSSCSGTGGPMVLTATALPWLGGAYQARCTGMAANSLGVSLFGFGSQNTPLSTLHPAAGPSCMLLASPDAVTLLLPVAGEVTHQFPLPLDPGLVGVTLHHQVLQGEFGAVANLTWLGGSNALVLTTGTY